GQLLLKLLGDGLHPVAEAVTLGGVSAGAVLLLLGLRERGQVLGEQEPLQFAVLVQPPLPLGLVPDLAQGAGESLRLEPRGDGAVLQVGLVRGRLLALWPQAERLLDANRHRLRPPSPNAPLSSPARSGGYTSWKAVMRAGSGAAPGSAGLRRFDLPVRVHVVSR